MRKPSAVTRMRRISKGISPLQRRRAKPLGGGAPGGPTAVGHAGQKGALGPECHTHDATRETAAKGETGSLPNPVDLFQIHAHDAGRVLITDEDLSGEGTECAAGGIPGEARGGASHLVVREPNGGQTEGLDLFGDVDHRHPIGHVLFRQSPGRANDHPRWRRAPRGGLERCRARAVPACWRRTTRPGCRCRRGPPRALPSRPDGERRPATMGVVLPSESTFKAKPRHLARPKGSAPKGLVGGDPQGAIGPDPRTEVVLVVVATDGPGGAQGLQLIEPVVPIRVAHAY